MEKMFNKLVRDKIPEIIRADGREPVIRKLEEKEYIEALKRKVVEEATELAEAGKREDIVKEIGDVYEVIDALIMSMDLNKEEILKVQTEKRLKRGGFEERVFLEKEVKK